MKKAAELIEQVFQSISFDDHKEVISLFSSWEELAGTNIASHSRIYDLEGTSLIVHVDHPGWLQLIDMKKNQILRNIKKEFPDLAVERIVTYVSS